MSTSEGCVTRYAFPQHALFALVLVLYHIVCSSFLSLAVDWGRLARMSTSVHDGDDESGRFVSHSPDQMSLVGSELQGDQDHGDTNNVRSHDGATQIHEERVQNGGGNGRVIAHGSDAGSGEDEDEDAEEAEGEDADSEDEGEDDYEEDEDDEDEEPTLKYERLNGPVDLLQKDSASALTYANNRLVLGTHAGILHVLDLQGEIIKSVKPHTARLSLTGCLRVHQAILPDRLQSY
ncbi:hypothetical protein BDW22DRAFT_1001398 [Trametopsis cervina]|nr:hypothetical protein BDW22DRAFT_1001398 [Trametopsis cervina]